MRRLCAESSCSYPGRSVSPAVRAAMGAELRASPKELELPSDPKGVVVTMGSGLRASAKALETPPVPTVTRAARSAATPDVTGQKSAEAVLAKPWRKGGEVKGRT